MSDAKDRDTGKTAPTTPAEHEGMDHTFDAPADPSLSGRKIGAYSLRRLIGSGGMGAVYEAIQESPRRTVAVKLMRKGITSKSALRRFEFESQILARLRHPAIAQVYEAGTHDEDGEATPYFVMEYIPGALPLTTYAQRHDLSIRDRMKLFLQVCEAVQHGHLKGIVHRDLKPGNILISSHGKPKIIDFGVARSTDSDMALTTLQTDIGQILGTLQYMSPEQCAADPNDIDTRSDVYALGVVLHELLTGDVPYDVRTAALHEAVRIVQEERPTRLSSIDRRLKGDLETITGKALEKERRRRYQSASALAEDIGHWLDDEPINARAPGAIDLVSRFARRHTAAALAVTGVFIALVVAVTVMAISTAEAQRQRDAAEAARASELAQRDAADSVKNFLKSMIANIDPKRSGGMDKTLMIHMLDQATDRIDTEFAGQPLLQAELRTTLGDTWRGLGQYDRAVGDYRAAHDLLIAHHGADSLPALMAGGRLGRVLRSAGKHDEAIDLLITQIDGLNMHLAPEDPGVLQFQGSLAMAYIDLNRPDDALQILEHTTAAWATHDAPTSNAVANLVTLGELHLSTGNVQDAEAALMQALQDVQQLPVVNTVQELGIRYKLAISHAMRGDMETAVPMLRDLLQTSIDEMGPDHPHTMTTAGTLGGVLANSGDLAGAEPLFKQVYEGQLSTLGLDHPNTLTTLTNLGSLQMEQGKLELAESSLRNALTTSLSLGRHDHPLTITIQRALGMVLLDQGKLNDALPLLETYLQARVGPTGEDTVHTTEALQLMIEWHRASGDTAAADDLQVRLDAITE